MQPSSLQLDSGSSLASAAPALRPRAHRRQTLATFFLCALWPVAASAVVGPDRFAAVAGLCFALACAAATYATQPRHKVRLARGRTLGAIALGALGQPVIAVLALVVLGLTGSLPSHRAFAPTEEPRFLLIIGVASALCALLAAGAASIWARTGSVRLLVVMLGVALVWPATLFLVGPLSGSAFGRTLFPRAFLLVPFGPAMTFAWDVPMALLTAWWLSGAQFKVSRR